MNNSKNSIRKNQLNSNSTLFLQLGIILSLVLVHHFFELEFTKEVSILPDQAINLNETTFSMPKFEVKKKKQTPEKKQTMDMNKIIIDDPISSNKPEPNLIEDPKPPESEGKFNGIIEVIIDEPDAPMPIDLVEQAPRYPGCKGASEVEFKKCLNQKIVKFISKKFNQGIDLGNNYKGKQKIHVQFEIDKTGKIINIEARSAHKKLEKEAIRVVDKLPIMIPGKQQNRSVSVKYYMPISFYIQ